MRTLALVTLLVMMPGCIIVEEDHDGAGGPGPTGEPSGSDAEAQFDQTVEPILVDSCDACHGSAFDYANLIANTALDGDFNPAHALLLTKGAHEGPALTASQADTIANWLDAEAAARGL